MAVRLFEGKDHASAYLHYRVTPLELIGTIISYMEKKSPGPFGLAVDVGCGSGQGTVLLAPYFTQVLGLDVSPAQLEMALVNGCPPNVTYKQSPAEQLPVDAGQVDLLASMTAAHWFDRQKFLLEADRVLRPGGCLALLSYTMDMELEHGDTTEALNDVCKEFYTTLLPYRNPHLGSSTVKIYADMFASCPYPDKEWNECFRLRRTVSLNGYIGMVETFSNYQVMLKKDPAEAQRLSQHIRTRLLEAMKVSSPDSEVTVVVKYFNWLARKPL